MVINGVSLLIANPIKNMLALKHRDAQGVSHGLAEVGYDIRIKQTVDFCPGETFLVDARLVQAQGTVLVLNDVGETSMLGPGNFCLASAMEEFDMPDNLVGIVHDKSTWARCGLSVFNTVIEPGWKGFLTLELTYHGTKRLHIPAGSGIAQVIFHRLTDPAAYKGSYQNQVDEPVPSIVTT